MDFFLHQHLSLSSPSLYACFDCTTVAGVGDGISGVVQTLAFAVPRMRTVVVWLLKLMRVKILLAIISAEDSQVILLLEEEMVV